MASKPPVTIDLRGLARLAWAHRGRLVLVQLAVTAVATAVVFLLPRWYTSSVTLVPAPSDGLTLDFSGIGAGLGATSFSLNGQPTPQDQLKMVVTSRAVADSVIHRFDLVHLWKVKLLDRAREKLAEHTTVTTPKEGQIEVAVEARTPVMARDLAQAFASYAASEATRLKTSLASQRRLYLEARLRDIEREITIASMRMREFEEKNGAVALPEQTKETMDAAGTLQAQVALLETELAGARRFFTDQSPEVELITDRLTELKRQIDQIARQGGTFMLKGDQLPALKQQYLQLTREQTSLIEVSALLRRIYEQARVEEANPVATFSVLDAAEVPERHSRPKRAMTVALAFALSLATALGVLQWRAASAAGAPAAIPRPADDADPAAEGPARRAA